MLNELVNKVDWSKWKSDMVELEVYAYDDRMLTMKVPRELTENYKKLLELHRKDSKISKEYNMQYIEIYYKLKDYFENMIDISIEHTLPYSPTIGELPVILIEQKHVSYFDQIVKISKRRQNE